MENKNLLLAVLLSVGFLFFWSMFVIPKLSPRRPLETPAAMAHTPAVAEGSPQATIGASHDAPIPTALADTIFRDSNNEIVFSSQGGSVRHWRLKLKGHEVDLVAHPDLAPLPLATFPESTFKIRQNSNQVILEGTSPQG